MTLRQSIRTMVSLIAGLMACQSAVLAAPAQSAGTRPISPQKDRLMQLGYVILYVPDVEVAVSFYEKAFDLKRRFVSADYGEIETGATALAFASEAMAVSNGVSIRHARAENDEAAAVEIAFVLDDPASAYDKAVAAGARAIKSAAKKPWGQTVAYVRDLNGFLVELCTPVAPK